MKSPSSAAMAKALGGAHHGDAARPHQGREVHGVGCARAVTVKPSVRGA
jgi:hypothetical protein